MSALLELDHVSYRYRGGTLALEDISVIVEHGRSVGLVGESGAGKSTIISLLLGLSAPTGGQVLFESSSLLLHDRAQMKAFRRSVQAVFQDPYSSLDPRQSIGRIVAEPLRSLRITRGADAKARVAEALVSVGLTPDVANRYPHEFSGGQRQRIAIARAIVCHPRLLLADEPVSGLDMTICTQIINLLSELCENQGLTIVMVSHDLSVIGSICRHIVVLQGGRVVEQGDTATVLRSPQRSYTRRLIAAVPRLSLS
jgi:ABC-type microcin C transport system duplicated ATPase subunit YejF